MQGRARNEGEGMFENALHRLRGLLPYQMALEVGFAYQLVVNARRCDPSSSPPPAVRNLTATGPDDRASERPRPRSGALAHGDLATWGVSRFRHVSKAVGASRGGEGVPTKIDQFRDGSRPSERPHCVHPEKASDLKMPLMSGRRHWRTMLKRSE